MESFLKDNIFYLLFCALIFLQITYWPGSTIGLVLLVVYLSYVAKSVHVVMGKLFGLSKAFRIRVLSAFFALMFLGFLASLAILFFRLNAFYISLAFLITGIFFSILEFWVGPLDDSPPEMYDPHLKVLEEMPIPTFTTAIYLILFVYGLFLLLKSKTGAPILSPWQTIEQNYIYVFALATLILGALVFSKLKAKTVLFLLFLHSFLLHGYLPLTHDNFYGADGWRHLAVENQIISEIPLVSADFALSSGTFIQRIGWGELSYSQFWGLSIIFSKILAVDLTVVMIWFLPILWSLVLPITLFEIARVMGRSKKESLFFAWLSFLPYIWQTGGSFSLPVNLGFLFFIFSLILIYSRIKKPQFGQTLILGVVGLVSLFGYALFCLLFFSAWFLAEVIVFFSSKKVSRIFSGVIYFVGSVFLLFLIPVLELVSNYSTLNYGHSFWAGAKSFLGTMSGWYLASGPRTHDISAGNIIFNQTPSYAFVSNFFTASRWWLVIFMVLFFLGVIWGFWVSLKNKKGEHLLNNILFFSFFGSYIISRYFLAGENILSRRLDVVSAYFFLWFLVLALGSWGWGEKLLQSEIVKKYTQPVKKFSLFFGPALLTILVVIFTLAISASYTLGPDTKVVSKDELSAVEYIWVLERNQIRPCVLAGTYPLLALEAVSAKKIVGGGFPVYAYFSQPERVDLLNKLMDNPNVEILKSILSFVDTDHCWVLSPRIDDVVFRSNFKNVQMFGPLMAGEYVR